MKLVRQQPEDTTPSKDNTLQDDEEPSTIAQEQEIPHPEIIEFYVHPHDSSYLPPSEFDDVDNQATDIYKPNNPTTLNSPNTIENNHEIVAAIPEGKFTIRSLD
jgi:hypothetical protein